MRTALKLKFACPTLNKKLKDTGTAYLAEMNSYDTFWGTGVCTPSTDTNTLGRLLMEIRANI